MTTEVQATEAQALAVPAAPSAPAAQRRRDRAEPSRRREGPTRPGRDALGEALAEATVKAPAAQTTAIMTPAQALDLIQRGEFSKNQITDPFVSWTDGGGTAFNLIPPPYNMTALLQMVNDNSVLRQCVEAMVTNVAGHGWTLEYIGPEAANESAEALAEKTAIEGFLKHPNEMHSIMEVLKRFQHDLESTGNAFLEVARDDKGRVSAVWHIPAHLIRLTEAEREPVEIEVDLPRFDGPVRQTVRKHFRRYVQQRGMRKVYFKEYGDPRVVDPSNGTVSPGMSLAESATEIIHQKLYHAGSEYGSPRWVNNLVAVQGSRQAELTNLDFFAENAIPAMAVLVSGGALTGGSMRALEGHFQALRGRRSMQRVVFLEAYADDEAAPESGVLPAPKLELKPLASERPQDGLFLEYDKAQTTKVRSSFRLPPLFLGLADDYTYATANTSYIVAESQVFGPERVRQDEIINDKVLIGYSLKYWRYRSQPPRISDPEQIIKAIHEFEALGAMTPNIAIAIANEVFDLDIKPIADEWGNFPFVVVKALAARGAVKGWEEIIDKEALKPPTPPGQTPGQTPGKPPAKPPAKAPGETPSNQAKWEEASTLSRKVLQDLRDALTGGDPEPQADVEADAETDAINAAVRIRARADVPQV